MKFRKIVSIQPWRSLGLILLGLVPISMAMAGCGDGRTPLIVYSPHGRDLLELVEGAFEQEHPEIDVRWLDMGSQDVFDRIRSEAANPQAGVWFGGPNTIFIQGTEFDLLESFRPSWAEAVPASSRGEGDLFFGTYLAMPVLVYHADAVAPEDVPEDWDDLLDPRFDDEVLIRDPLASGTMRTMFGMILSRSVAETGDEEAGWAWLRRLDAQTKEYVLNPALMIEKLVRKEGLVTTWDLTDILLQQQRGMPLGYRFPTSGVPVIDDSIGLVKGAPQPEAAKAFIEFVGSRPAQRLVAETVYRIPARTDLPPDELPEWAQRVLAEMKTADVDWDLLAERGQDWMDTWDRTVRSQGD